MLDFGFYFIWSIGLWLFLSSLGATLMIFLKTTSDLCNRPIINKRAASSEYLKYKDSFPNSYRTALCTGTLDILIVSSPGVYNTAGQNPSCAGTIASSVSSSQYYDICIRRARSYCSVCYSLENSSTTTGTPFFFGVCGVLFNAAPQTTHATACSWAVPFQVGVHFVGDDATGAPQRWRSIYCCYLSYL